jgi:hyperosmotically inducible protein
MNSRIVALTCALAAAACAGSDRPPAQDPTASGTAAMQSTPTVAPSSATDSAAAANAADQNSRTASGIDPGANSASTTASERTPDPNPNRAPVATDNPGTADQTKNADNTRINERDRHGALTPMDQGNGGSEIKITAAIRKGLMGDKTLSFTAKNVKVITVGNKVTLRGPVKSDQEKATIEALARQTAGVAEVDDQLEVKK